MHSFCAQKRIHLYKKALLSDKNALFSHKNALVLHNNAQNLCTNVLSFRTKNTLFLREFYTRFAKNASVSQKMNALVFAAEDEEGGAADSCPFTDGEAPKDASSVSSLSAVVFELPPPATCSIKKAFMLGGAGGGRGGGVLIYCLP